ncbi:MAG: FkbM family methyltransferase [Planctomycetota bacterium]|nr:FkbM family methyltransferase [Planctomycetota bacterium]
MNPYRALYRLLSVAGRPFGGIRPRRLYDVLGRKAYPRPEFAWHRNRWGAELYLSHYYHIDRNIIILGCYDQDLHQALEHLVKPGMVCFDVGANLGEMALHMAALAGPTGAVHAFEPVPAVYERLAMHAERNGLPNLRPHQLALSNRTGRCSLAYAEASADNQGLASLVNTAQPAVSLRAEVNAMTLDDFVSREQVRRLDLMKVDIQGAEIALLEGGRQSLAGFSPDLLMEISPADLGAAGHNSRDLCRMLEDYGYAIYRIKRGRPGTRITASAVTPGFSATNVYCTKHVPSSQQPVANSP